MMRLLRIADALPHVIEFLGDDVPVRTILADSRRISAGDLFVAIQGVQVDGHRFVGEAVEAGAVAVIGERPAQGLPGAPGADYTYVRVRDSREAWGWACAAWEGLPSRQLTLVGVTGTDGKTTTVTLIHAILAAAGLTCGMLSTVRAVLPSADPGTARLSDGGAAEGVGWEEADTGLHTTTPDPPQIQRYLAELVERGATHAVLEVTSHGLAQHRVAGCYFDVAAVTNVTHEHLDYHRSLAAYQRAKARLFEGLETSFRKPHVPKVAVLNRDDDSFHYLSGYQVDRQVTYAMERTGDVTANDVQHGREGTRFTLGTPKGSVRIDTRLKGAHNVSNILAAAAVGVGLDVPPLVLGKGIGSVQGVPGRLERVDEGQPFLAIVDFAHTPNALKKALTAARDLVGDAARVIVVFGCAGLRDRTKRAWMGRIAGELADVVVVTAEDPRTEPLQGIMDEIGEAAQAAGKRKGVELFLVEDRGEAILRACQLAEPDDLVIACGKGHEQSMCFGQTEYPWDDRTAMRLALKGQTLDTLPTAASGDPAQAP